MSDQSASPSSSKASNNQFCTDDWVTPAYGGPIGDSSSTKAPILTPAGSTQIGTPPTRGHADVNGGKGHHSSKSPGAGNNGALKQPSQPTRKPVTPAPAQGLAGIQNGTHNPSSNPSHPAPTPGLPGVFAVKGPVINHTPIAARRAPTGVTPNRTPTTGKASETGSAPETKNLDDGIVLALTPADIRSLESTSDATLKIKIHDAFQRIDERMSPFPEDEVAQLVSDSRIPTKSQEKWVSLVKKELDNWITKWQVEGRTHEVLDGLLAVAKAARAGKDSWQVVSEAVKFRFSVLALTSPLTTAIENQKNIFLSLSGVPQQPEFKQAVENAYNQFILEEPKKAALRIEQAYHKGDEQDIVAAALTLRELTAKADPLRAALIFKAAQPTINKIAASLASMHYSGTHYEKELFNDLSAAVENAGRSPEARASIDALAQQLMKPDTFKKYVYEGELHYVTPLLLEMRDAVSNGNATLALAMTKVFADSDFATSGPAAAYKLISYINAGLSDLRNSTKEQVNQLVNGRIELELPRLLWGNFVPSDTNEKWVKAHPGFEEKTSRNLASVNSTASKFVLAASAVRYYLPQMPKLYGRLRDLDDDLNNLVKLAYIPKNVNEDTALSTAISLSPAAAFEEARIANIDLLEELAGIGGNDVLEEATRKESPIKLKNAGTFAWAGRQGANAVRTSMYALDGKKSPSIWGTGMAFYRITTFSLGLGFYIPNLLENYKNSDWWRNQGWRVPGIIGLYATGAAAEVTLAISQIITKKLGLETTDPGWKSVIATTAAGRGFWKKFQYGWNSSILPWYAIATGNYFLNKDWARGTAEGIGTLGKAAQVWAKQISEAAIKNLEKTSVGTRLASLVGGETGLELGLTAAGSWVVEGVALAIAFLNANDIEKNNRLLAGYNENYLGIGSVPSSVAKALSKGGGAAGPILQALAEKLGSNPKRLMQWLIEQDKKDPKWLEWFIPNVLSVKTDANDKYLSHDDNNFVETVPSSSDTIKLIPTDEVRDTYHNKGFRLRHEGLWPTTLDGVVRLAEASGHSIKL